MLKRLYADNFRCLENFEVHFGEANALIGRNGTGKTSVLDVLHRIQNLLVRGAKVDQVFPAHDKSMSQRRDAQRFEIDVLAEDDLYAYELVIEHSPGLGKMRVAHEALKHNGRCIFDFNEGDAQLYRDDYTEGPVVPFDWAQSGVGFLTDRPDNRKVGRFKRDIAQYVIAGLCPPVMDAETRSEDDFLEPLMRNFVGWYRHAAQENMESVSALFDALRDVLPGFQAINLSESGENSRALKVVIATPSGSRDKLRFDQLSDGERALVALYSLLHMSSDRGVSIFLDEPDNFLALSEVQPWLAEAVQSCGDSIDQFVVASHHPVTIDYMASACGLWFSRDGSGPTRVTSEPSNTVDGLSMSETVARAWE